MQYASRLPCISVEIHDLDQTSRCIRLSTSISPICHRSMFCQNICLFRIFKHVFPGQKGSLPPCRARPKPRETKAPTTSDPGLGSETFPHVKQTPGNDTSQIFQKPKFPTVSLPNSRFWRKSKVHSDDFISPRLWPGDGGQCCVALFPGGDGNSTRVRDDDEVSMQRCK
jgi:hypothetical protein